MKSLRMMAVAGCVLALSGCGEEQDGLELSSAESLEKAPVALDQQLFEDVRYMRGLVEKSSEPFVMINFADDRQFRYALNRLKAAGKTPDNAPELFEGIFEARDRALLTRQIDAAPETYNHLIANILQDSKNADRITTDAYSTIKGGAATSYLDIIMYDGTTGAVLGDQFVEEQKSAGTDMNVRTAGTLAKDQGGKRYVIVDSFSCNDTTGEVRCSTSSVGTHLKLPGKLQAPVDQQLPGVPLDGMLTVCLNRSWLYDAYDCEYKMDGTGGNIVFPLKGEMNFEGAITKVKKAYVALGLANNGGACKPSLDFLKNVIIDGSRVRWDIPVANFGRNCFSHQADVNINIGVEVDVNLNGTNISGFGTISSQASDSNATIPQIQFASSCLAKGTEIRLADGSLLPVERVGQDMRVLADVDGLALSVTDMSIGVEDVPMLRLEDSFGHSLLLTEGHPVMTEEGPQRADALRLGDVLFTEQGPALLTSIGYEVYDGSVHNLKLGNAVERKLVGDEPAAFFANGILVGDGRVQLELANARDREVSTLHWQGLKARR